MIELYKNLVSDFIEKANDNGVRMLLVGGGAVNFHGYQRHSADIDFWIELTSENLNRLKLALNQLGYQFEKFPDEVLQGLQNISVKISPVVDLELITRFNPGKSFEQAFNDSVAVSIDGLELKRYHVISFEDLINSKIKSGREQDLRDVYMLQEIKKMEGR
jgi:predicted nucleotidyltransferase